MPGDLLASPAYTARSWVAEKVLTGILIEHAAHNGNENGNLRVSFTELCRQRVSRKSIRRGLVELRALGLIEFWEGHRSYGKHQAPNVYRITWLGTPDGVLPTNEWQRIKTVEEALARVERALEEDESKRPERAFRSVAAIAPARPRLVARSD
jgi:hypothetical protein